MEPIIITRSEFIPDKLPEDYKTHKRNNTMLDCLDEAFLTGKDDSDLENVLVSIKKDTRLVTYPEWPADGEIYQVTLRMETVPEKEPDVIEIPWCVRFRTYIRSLLTIRSM